MKSYRIFNHGNNPLIDKYRKEGDKDDMLNKEIDNIYKKMSNIESSTVKTIIQNTIGSDGGSVIVPSGVNSYYIHIASIADLVTTDYITLSQQYGNISESIRSILPGTIGNVMVNVLVSDGTTIKKFADLMTLSINQSANDRTLANPKMVDYAVKINSSKTLSLRIREFEESTSINIIGSKEYTGTTSIGDDLYTLYISGNLFIILEVVINVQL